MRQNLGVTATLAVLLCAGLSGQRATETLSEARIARVEQGLLPGVVVAGQPRSGMRLADRMAFYHVPGVSVAVIENGTIAWARGYGNAEAGGRTPVNPRTRFQAASISKPLASLAALLLVSQGRLSLDEPVNARLKSWKVPENDFTAQSPVTLRRLLSHTAGTTIHGFGGYPSNVPVPSLVQVLDGTAPANSGPVRVDVRPGSAYRYSGGGYTVVQQLLVDVTGKPFPALMSELVLGPLGMTDSTFEQPLPTDLAGQAATAHGQDGQPIPGRYHTYPEMAAAGLWTTPTDLAKFLVEVQRALAGQSRIIPAASAREMTTLVMGDYGLGLTLSGTAATARFGHGGSNAGFQCVMTAFVSGGHGVVIMTNGERGGRLANEVTRAVAREYDWKALQPVEKTVVRLDAAALALNQGRYELAPGRTLELRVIEGRLLVLDRGRQIELFAESASKFFDTEEENAIEFVKDANGAVVEMVINGSIHAKRLGPS